MGVIHKKVLPYMVEITFFFGGACNFGKSVVEYLCHCQTEKKEGISMSQTIKIVSFNLRSQYTGDGINAFIHRAGMIYDKIKKEAPDTVVTYVPRSPTSVAVYGHDHAEKLPVFVSDNGKDGASFCDDRHGACCRGVSAVL